MALNVERVRLVEWAVCQEKGCGWRDDGKNPDLAARKHEKATSHSTRSGSVPEGSEHP